MNDEKSLFVSMKMKDTKRKKILFLLDIIVAVIIAILSFISHYIYLRPVETTREIRIILEFIGQGCEENR